MFKLVVLCAFLALAAAKPDLLIAPAYSTTVVEPAKTTISKQASSVIHPSPLNAFVYSAAYPFAHLIKKRGAPLAVSTYIAPSYDFNAYTYPSSFIQNSAIIPAPTYSTIYRTAHLIKKRSAPLIATPTVLTRSYIASTPLATSYSYINSAPLVSTPYSYFAPAHFIKKRSAPLITSYYSSNYAAPWYTPYTYASAAPIISTPYISSFPYSSLYFKK